jgi:hypothetical protein
MGRREEEDTEEGDVCLLLLGLLMAVQAFGKTVQLFPCVMCCLEIAVRMVQQQHCVSGTAYCTERECTVEY